MKLIELDPQFLRYEPVTENGQLSIFHRYVDTLEEAQGVLFLCPKCYASNGGAKGTHSVICWSSSRGVPDEAYPRPGRWKLLGTGYEDLTLGSEPGRSNSVLLLGGCAWHGFVINGEAT